MVAKATYESCPWPISNSPGTGLIAYLPFRVVVFLLLFRIAAFLGFGLAFGVVFDPPLLVLTLLGLAEKGLAAVCLPTADHSYLQRLQLQRFVSNV
jgi:hypothetical protein